MSSAEFLHADGERVSVSVARRADIEPYRRAMTRSAARIGSWNPVNPGDLVHHLAAQSEKHRTFLIRAHDDVRAPHDTAGLVGCVNVSNVVQGRFMSATMGYNAFDPYVGQGLFREGLVLVVDIALRPTPSGMGLHRVEANVRTANATSAGVLRSLGFRRERTVRRMLWLADGPSGANAWRDHDSYAITREEWPARAYAEHDSPAGVIVLDDAISELIAVALARELTAVALFGLPYAAALDVAAYAGAPIVWCAGSSAERALVDLTARGVRAARPDDVTAAQLRKLNDSPHDARAFVQQALNLRPRLS